MLGALPHLLLSLGAPIKIYYTPARFFSAFWLYNVHTAVSCTTTGAKLVSYLTLMYNEHASYSRINSLTSRSLVICSSFGSPRVEYLTRLHGDGYPATDK